jgi:hypothetical protein
LNRTIIPPTNQRTITVPRGEQEDARAITITVPWVCLVCGGLRGAPVKGSTFDSWQNYCEHVESYREVRAAYIQAMRRRQIIRTDGTIELLHEPVAIGKMDELIEASKEKGCDHVTLHALGLPYIVMFVDGGGWEVERTVTHDFGGHGSAPRELVRLTPVRALRPHNQLATELYRLQASGTHTIVGDVVLIPDSDYGGGPDGL